MSLHFFEDKFVETNRDLLTRNDYFFIIKLVYTTYQYIFISNKEAANDIDKKAGKGSK